MIKPVHPIPTLLAAALATVPFSGATAGEGCLSPTVEIYTTRDLYLEEGGTADGCMREQFPLSEGAYVAGWTQDEGNFGVSDPFQPESWNSTGGLALAIETCYQVATWPNFPPGTCGLPMHPTYEGELHPSGLFGKDWVMRWYFICDNPDAGIFEFRKPIVRIDHCPDDLEIVMRDGFEQ
jgi:hypothetical protein